MKKFFQKRKITSLLILAVFLVSQVGVLAPKTAYAQWSVLNPDIIAQNIQGQLSETIKGNIENSWVASIASMLVNVMMASVNYASYQAAISVATGGPADSPLFTSLPPEEYLQYVGANVVYEAYKNVESADSVLTAFGVRVPDDPAFLASIRAGLKSSATSEVGEFDYRDILGNWDGFLVSVYDSNDSSQVRTAKILSTVAATFDSNEYRSGLDIYSQALFEAQNKKSIAANQQNENAGFLDKVDPITGNTLVPAATTRKQFEDAIAAVQELPTKIGLASLGEKSVLLQMGLYAGSIFTQTLGSELMQQLLTKGLVNDFDVDPFNPSARTGLSRERAQDKYKSLLSFRPIQISDYDLLSRLSSCSSRFLRNSPQLYSCAMDTSFAAAVARADAGIPLTLTEAIEEGYIDENWPLIPSSDTARNQDTNCYTYGFCHSNLLKLRKARLIPIGWELATEAQENSASSPVTLGEVMNSFNDCDENNERSDTHPWCHLIDPNWVLKYPASQCRTLAYGQLLTAGGATDRSEECVDVQSCISENDDGTCSGGYGYCVREKNVWDFRGDSCPAQYASCLSFETSGGDAVDLLTNTVDFGNCDENSVGCAWYATQKNEDATGTYNWPQIGDVFAASTSVDAYKDRIYLNNNVEDCNESEGGCEELIVRKEGLSLNLILNPSFELDKDGNGWPDIWLSQNWLSTLDYSIDGSQARSGNSALWPRTNGFGQTGIILDQRQLYTVSFYAKQQTSGGVSVLNANVTLEDEFDTERPDLRGYSVQGDCTLLGTNQLQFSVRPSDDYTRTTCTFTAPGLVDASSQINAFLQFNSANVWIDDVQFEQIGDASIFHADYNESSASLAITTVKLPPDYLGCKGDATDPAECANFARICAESNRGCNLYSPKNGDPAVSGIVSQADVCPSICVGYETYKQEPTLYEPNGAFPLSLIPSTAESCREQAVGCDQFTNIANEQTEYFTSLRACVTESQASTNVNSDGASVFYTWEGSDVEGFQLKTWQLIESDISDAPCTNWRASASGITCDDANGQYVGARVPESCNEHSDIFTNPDCREFYDATGDIYYRQWSETVTVNNSCATYRKTDLVGAGRDTNGNSIDDGQENCTNSGGYFDLVTAQCRYFGFSQESSLCKEKENGCRKYTGGTSRNSRVAFEEVFESGTLNAWDATSASVITLSNDSIATGGHSLRSTGKTVWTHLFSNGVPCASALGCTSTTGILGGSCVVIDGKVNCGTLENELYANKTYTLTFWAKGTGTLTPGFDITANPGSISVDAAFTSDINLTSDWKRYSVGPLNMTSDKYPLFGAGSVLAFVPSGATVFNIDNVVLREGEADITLIKDSWVTPAQCDMNLQAQPSPQFHLGCQEYADQGGKNVYLKSVSRLCSEDNVGCSAYYKTAQSSGANAQILNATCSNLDLDGVAGADTASVITPCYLATNPSGFSTKSPKVCDIYVGETSCLFNLDAYLPESLLELQPYLHISYGPETAYVEADRAVYAVVNPENVCAIASAGCQEIGDATLSADQSVVDSWDSKWVINDPDQYNKILCSGEQLYCDAFDAGKDGIWYFKNPQARTCEYRNDVYINGTSYDGWFRTGKDEFCYGTGTCSNDGTSCLQDSECRDNSTTAVCNIKNGSYVVGGSESGIWKNGDPSFASWAGTCGAEFNGCSEFRDVLDYAKNEFYAETTGESYFFVDNDNLDENTLLSSQKCNGLISQDLGCVLFHDTGEPGMDYNASASYISSRHADTLFGSKPFSLVKPITCDRGASASTITAINGSSVDLCANRCVYPKKSMLTTDAYASLTFATSADEYIVSGSCFTDLDCPSYDSAYGDTVSGTCKNIVETVSGGFAPQPVPRLSNDTNRVLKVNRDRECSEWLTCSSSQTVWDEETSSFRTICNEVDLCTEYSNTGDSSFCSKWNPDDPAVVLDANRYVSRDITWYGEDYSGYAVPNLFPVQHLTQVNVAPPGTCEGSIVGREQAQRYSNICEQDSDCTSNVCSPNIEKDYRLAFEAGTCDGNFASACTVGFCSDTGATCSKENDCNPDAKCSVGICRNSAGEDTDEFCGLDLVCSPGLTCFQSVSTKQGSCYYGKCTLSPEGNRMNDETGETSVCRANPEIDSPFGNDVVEQWISASEVLINTANPTPSSSMGVRSLPYNTKSGFENVNLCAPGEVCECTYKKISTSVGVTAYLDDKTNLNDLVRDPALGDDAGGRLGICSGGDADGSLCVKDGDCNGIPASVSGGTPTEVALGKCYPITREDTLVGLEGYCLERDTGINVKGDPNTGACLTWLPVDQLEGSTDLFAKYQSAGVSDDAYYCAEVKMFLNASSSVGCSAIRGSDGTASTDSGPAGGVSEQNSEYCQHTVSCPDGYWAIVGRARYSATGTSGTANRCQSGIQGSDDLWTRGNNACPYMCIPKNSIHTDTTLTRDTNLCNTSIKESDLETSVTETKYLYESDFTKYTELEAKYADCTYFGSLSGVSSIPDDLGISGFNTSGNINGNGGEDYAVKLQQEKYPACYSLIQLSSETGKENAAYTDRLLNPNANYTIEVGNLNYKQNTSKTPFGISLPPTAINTNSQGYQDATPIIPPSCIKDTDPKDFVPTINANDPSSCPSGYSPSFPQYINTSIPEAREFVTYSPSSIAGRDLTTTDSIRSIQNRLKSLFAFPITLWRWTSEIGSNRENLKVGGETLGSYAEEPQSSGVFSQSDWDERKTGNPPTIWSVDTQKCYGAYCQEGEKNELTVNGQNGGDQSGAGGFFRGTLQFFAAADKNQLPLRRVIINWGDGKEEGSETADNYYKNHRGLGEGSQTKQICQRCDDGGTDCEWGMTVDSCDPNYFSYQHNYRCSEGDTKNLPLCSDVENENGDITQPCTDKTACYFQPRVHIRDNWGWCSGVCTRSGNDSCFDDIGSLDAPASNSECYYLNDNPTDLDNPWVYYSGRIRVEP